MRVSLELNGVYRMKRGLQILYMAWVVGVSGTVSTAGPFDPARDFAAHCFSPFLTADMAQRRLEQPGVRVDFYDLRPFSDVAASPVAGRAATPGTDRRCELAYDGDEGAQAAKAAVAGLEAEGIRDDAPVPDGFEALPGTTLLAARYLNPNRVAVVHTGTRLGPNGIETFLTVERMEPGALD